MTARRFFALAAALCFGCAGGDGIPNDLTACGQKATCGNGPMFVINTLSTSDIGEDGSVAGFDLDGVVSDGNGPDDCHTVDYVSPTGKPGIDNQLTRILNTVDEEIRTLPLLIQNAIATGGLLLIGELIGLDDPVNDDRVGLVFRRSEEVPLVGTDGVLLENQTFKLAPNHFAGAVADGYVENGVFHAADFDLAVKLTVFGVNYFLTFRGVQIELALDGEGKVTTGMFGGSIHLDDLFDIADTIVVEDLGRLVKAIVPPFADVKSSDGRCEQISGALHLTGIPAYVFSDVAGEGSDVELSGEQIYVKAGCIGCHATSRVEGATADVGPSLNGLGSMAGTRMPGTTSEVYVRQSILNPEAFIVDGYEPMSMPSNLRAAMTDSEFETLIAWLLTL